jgi:hypothetical protein
LSANSKLHLGTFAAVENDLYTTTADGDFGVDAASQQNHIATTSDGFALSFNGMGVSRSTWLKRKTKSGLKSSSSQETHEMMMKHSFASILLSLDFSSNSCQLVFYLAHFVLLDD